MYKEWALRNISKNKNGFTIVELLIVVVVIAILAAITIVAYNGIQNRAKESAAQAGAAQATKKIAQYAALNSESYPDQTSFTSATGINSSTDLSYDYLVTGDLKNYCVSAAPSNVAVPAYAATNTSGGTTKGRCVTNLEPNPSSETVMINGAGGGAATRSLSSTQKFSGVNSTKFTWGSGAAGMQSSVVSTTPSTTYSVSLYIYSESGAIPVFTVSASDYSTNAQQLTGTVAGGSWQRVTRTYTTTASQTNIRVWNTMAAASTYYIDAIMITPLSAGTPAYADGSNANWVWTNAANGSSSFGPSIIQ